ncbi:MAG: galactose-1-phosphate uridylyltransferase [Gemmatimonadetes bacterium]|jgi:UDPglucose--hexose-1-phosphate uridylyltransferase|nr:galactose-1-phosphate uridylyltransferase [Gemmatimonadota bacterium]MBT4609692.1 galactose-1-phosphate uridylyltransferase [Gemmatimonadota bacterium]MBT5056199.1 galactose-1-phosphate uridylyltransferase [Gemmatimonadota bacterium]MBT5146345.1 galactose-1-phosphate uridylyltransferase [Gemmatimonadota bacterium]MBT5591269.1 galactose-1-phosphate uridylyltransferase [Gemmatimonadota bacterium]
MTQEKWEQRWHPLRQEWVIIAGHRQDRPWSGETLAAEDEQLPQHVDNCYLCPGNTRVSGEVNPDFAGVHVFDNDHPCVGPLAPENLASAPGVYDNAPATGLARVICYGPEHHLRLSRLPLPRVVELLQTWQQQYAELGARDEIDHVLIFENNGDAVGVSNPHPHGQIYATNFIFKTTETEVAASEAHRQATGRGLFEDMIASEREDGRRILDEADTALSFVPYCARYAYEVFVAPKQRHASIADLSTTEIDDLAVVLRSLLARYDNLWQMSFPYVMALHNAPTDGADYSAHHFYISLHPPLRKPNLLKYLAGPELGGGNFIADTWPEAKAAELRACPTTHYVEDLSAKD